MHRDFISDYFARNGLPLEVVTADLEEDAGYGVPLDQEEAFYEEFIEFFHYQDRRAPPREGKRPVGSGKRPKKTVPPTGQQQAVPLEPVKTNPAPFKREIQHIVVDGAYFFKWSEVIEARYGTEYQALVTSFDLSPRIQLGIIAFLDKSLAATGFSTEDCLVTFTDGEKTYGIPWMIKDEFEDWFARNAKDQFLQYVMNDFGSSSEDEAADEDVDSTGKGDEEDELMSPPRRGGLRTVIDEDTEEDEEDEATVDMEMEPFKIPVPKETPVDVSNAVTTTPEENAMTMQSLFGESGPQEPLSYVASAAATEDEASALSMNFQMPQLWPTQQCQQQSPATGQVAFEFPITSMAELPVSGPSQEQQQQQYQETTDPVEIMRVFTSNPEDSGCENLCMAMKAGEEQASSTVMAQDPHQSFSEKEAPMSKAEQNAMEHVRTELSSARNSLESLTTLLNAPVVVPLPLSKKEDQEQKNPRTLLDIETEAGENSSL